MKDIPKYCDVVVIGGGPGGSATATLLARDGLHVVLLEKAKHPRPQVGESLIPHVWKFLDLIGASQKIEKDRFLKKAGGIILWEEKLRQIRFSNFGFKDRAGLHVERDRFDWILLRHAEDCGAEIFEEVIVRRVDFGSGENPVVQYEDRRDEVNVLGSIGCKYVIDASGPTALLASQFNARRRVQTDGKFVGLWGYFNDSKFIGEDHRIYTADKLKDIVPVTFICSYEDGWAWHIVLRENTSVGLVLNSDKLKGKGKAGQELYLLETCASIPYMKDLLADAVFIKGSLFFRPDYSYYSEKVCGDSFFCVGDAAAFVDPIFSQGVVTAMYNAVVCSWALTASLKKPQRKKFYESVYKERLLQYYGFSRLLAFGDFGGAGIDPAMVRTLVCSMPRNELELSLAASFTVCRSENMIRIADESGLLQVLGEDFLTAKTSLLDDIIPSLKSQTTAEAPYKVP